MAKKLYFDNDYTEKKIALYKKTKNVKYRNDAIVEIGKIVNAIINLYRYWRYEERDVLENEGYIACLKAIEKFDPNKFKSKSSLAFRYFSLVIKKHLAFITCKESKFKNRNNVTDDMNPFVGKHHDSILFNHNQDISELMIFFENCLFFSLKKKLRVIGYLKRYVEMNQKHFDKKGFISYAKGYGITQSYVRKILKEVETSKPLYQVYLRHNNSGFWTNGIS